MLRSYVIFLPFFCTFLSYVHSSLSGYTEHLPVEILINRNKITSGSTLEDAISVRLCAIDWEPYKRAPYSLPMYGDLIRESNCGVNTLQSANNRSVVVSFRDLFEEYTLRGCGSSGNFTDGIFRNVPANFACVPHGIVFHQSRCGSTTVANMLASLPNSLTFSEPSAIAFLLWPEFQSAPIESRISIARTIFALLGRSLSLHKARGTNPYQFDENMGHFYIKMQSAMSLHIPFLRTVFPEVPIAFVHRDGVPILMSLFRNIKNPPSIDSSPDTSLQATDMQMQNVPCMRNFLVGNNSTSWDLYVAYSSLVFSGGKTLEDVSAEEFCAITISLYTLLALTEGEKARKDALLPYLPGTERDYLDPESMFLTGADLKRFHELVPSTTIKEGIWTDKTSHRGVINRVGQVVFIDYNSLFDTAQAVIQYHFGVPLNDEMKGVLDQVVQKYSKGRQEVLASPAKRSVDPDGIYIEDTQNKIGKAWSHLQLTSDLLLSPLQKAIRQYNILSNVPAPSSAQPHEHLPIGTGQNLLPPGQGYPVLFPIADMLASWNPDIVTPPPHYGAFTSLRYFDAQNETEMIEAKRYRELELPFVLRNVTGLSFARKWWADDRYLIRAMKDDAMYPAEMATHNHFMFSHSKTLNSSTPYFAPPTEFRKVDLKTWLDESANVTRYKVLEEMSQLPAWWLPEEDQSRDLDQFPNNLDDSIVERSTQRIAWGQGISRGDIALDKRTAAESILRSIESPVFVDREEMVLTYVRASSSHDGAYQNPFINRDLGVFVDPNVFEASKAAMEQYWRRNKKDDDQDVLWSEEPPVPTQGGADHDFFIPDPSGQKGIHCRFGQNTIIAEAHFDVGRNFINMIRGYKRYILSPIEECPNYYFYTSGPSSRHSYVNWSSEEGIEALRESGALGTEVILGPGDSMYVPSLYIHFIVSLSTNIQCNTRSGSNPMFQNVLDDCGFKIKLDKYTMNHTSPRAMDFQASRKLHLPLWKHFWPEEVYTDPSMHGLEEALQQIVPPRDFLSPVTGDLVPFDPSDLNAIKTFQQALGSLKRGDDSVPSNEPDAPTTEPVPSTLPIPSKGPAIPANPIQSPEPNFPEVEEAGVTVPQDKLFKSSVIDKVSSQVSPSLTNDVDNDVSEAPYMFVAITGIAFLAVAMFFVKRFRLFPTFAVTKRSRNLPK